MDSSVPRHPEELARPGCHSTAVTGPSQNMTQLEYGHPKPLESAYEHNREHDPLQRFPPEIATNILHHAIPTSRVHEYSRGDPMLYLNPSQKVPTRPLELSAVCRHWRDLAFADPHFWTTIVMRRTGPKWDLPQELVEQWVGRAGAQRLNIALEWDPPENLVIGGIMVLVEYVCSIAPRWRSVAFRLPTMLFSFFHFAEALTVDLEHFTIMSSYAEDCFRLSLWNAMIQPKTATLVGIPTPPSQILWDNVTDLNMRMVISGALLGIIPNLTRAHSISVSFIPDVTGRTYPRPTAPVALPHLTSFIIENIEIQDVTSFFPHLNAPRLSGLSITRRKPAFEHDLEDIAALPLPGIRRLLMGSEVLHAIVFSGIPMLPNDLIALLETLPSLRMVSLTDYADGGAHAVSDALFTRLASTVAIDDGADKFLPKLKRFMYTGPRTFSWTMIADFLQTHNKCSGLRGPHAHAYDDAGVPLNLRPFVQLRLHISPHSFPEDLVDREVLKRFMELPGSWVRADIDQELMDASLKHHGIDAASDDSVFAWPDFDGVDDM